MEALVRWLQSTHVEIQSKQSINHLRPVKKVLSSKRFMLLKTTSLAINFPSLICTGFMNKIYYFSSTKAPRD